MDIISDYDLALKAKHKGYNNPCIYWTDIESHEIGDSVVYEAPDYTKYPKSIAVPTLYELLDWLRETHNIHIVVYQTNLPLTEPETTEWEWGFDIVKVDDPNTLLKFKMNYLTYEHALRDGLSAALDFI